MIEHFVTLFDSKYLPQGLELHQSMERHIPEFLLWIVCVDDKAYEVLSVLDLPRTRLLQLTKIETPELISVKAERSVAEYCWTVTPFAPRFVFEADDSVERVTYVDADLWFLKDPDPIFQEFNQSEKSVMITDHAYAPEYDRSEKYGRFCVQFMVFNRSSSEVVRKWWELKCIEWCYARSEDGKFGDQKYLDDWPTRFAEFVHVLENKELLLGPWNATRFPIGSAVAFHFHGVRIGRKRITLLSSYVFPHVLGAALLAPYFKGLGRAVAALRKTGFDHVPQFKSSTLFVRSLVRFRGVGRGIWGPSISSRIN